MYLEALKAKHTKASVPLPGQGIQQYNSCIRIRSDIPQKVLNIEPSRLRRHDRLRFKEGILVNSLQELAQLEEDFCS